MTSDWWGGICLAQYGLPPITAGNPKNRGWGTLRVVFSFSAGRTKQFFCGMNQFYLYDKDKAGAYNRARLKPAQGLSRGCDWSKGTFFDFLITDDHSEVPTFVSNLL